MRGREKRWRDIEIRGVGEGRETVKEERREGEIE